MGLVPSAVSVSVLGIPHVEWEIIGLSTLEGSGSEMGFDLNKKC